MNKIILLCAIMLVLCGCGKTTPEKPDQRSQIEVDNGWIYNPKTDKFDKIDSCYKNEYWVIGYCNLAKKESLEKKDVLRELVRHNVKYVRQDDEEFREIYLYQKIECYAVYFTTKPIYTSVGANKFYLWFNHGRVMYFLYFNV